MPVGQGQPLPEGPLRTIRERDGGASDVGSGPEPASGPPTLWGPEE